MISDVYGMFFKINVKKIKNNLDGTQKCLIFESSIDNDNG